MTTTGRETTPKITGHRLSDRLIDAVQEQEHHDASPCHDQACRFDHPHGGPFPHPCDEGRETPTGRSWTCSLCDQVFFGRRFECPCRSKAEGRETPPSRSVLRRTAIQQAGREPSTSTEEDDQRG